MRKKLLYLFLLFATVPIVLIYAAATAIFNSKIESDLRAVYTKDAQNMAQVVSHYFDESLDLTLYPLIEPNLEKFYTIPAESPQFAAVMENAQTILSASPYVLGGVRSVTLMRGDGVLLFSKPNYMYESSITREERENADRLDGGTYWRIEDDNRLAQISITRVIRSKSDLSQRLGYIKTNVSRYDLQNTMRGKSIEPASVYFLLDADGRVILSTGRETENALPSGWDYPSLNLLARQPVSTVSQKDVFISAQIIPRTPFLLCSVVEPQLYPNLKGTLVGVLTAVAVLTLFFFIILAFVFSKAIVRPLRELGQSMQKVSDEHFSARVQVRGKDEIAVLSTEFNRMAKRLEFLYEQVYMAQIELNRAQLMALQSQINPHFLYNAMDTIYWMSEMGDTRNVSRMVSNMTKVLRLTVTPDNQNMVPLKKELEHLTCYMDIQQMRYNHSIAFELSCEPGLQEARVLKLLLQPLVENALLHGLRDRERGVVFVRIFRQDSFLIYEVMNDGDPIDVDEIASLIQSAGGDARGMALRNIDKRLKLGYGPEYGLEFYLQGVFSVFKIRQRLILSEGGAPAAGGEAG